MSDLNSNNPTLDEIKDPVVRTRLDELQCVTVDLAAERDGVRSAIDQKTGIVQACKVLAKRLSDERVPVQKRVDDDGLDPDHAKAEIRAIDRCAQIVADIGVENQGDIIRLRGKVEGVEAAAKVAEKRFANELAKHARHQRMEEEAAAEQEALGRKKKPAKKSKKKAAKKSRKRPKK